MHKKSTFKKLSRTRRRELSNIKKWYIGTVKPRRHIDKDGNHYISLLVHYNNQKNAQYHTGIEYLAEYMGGMSNYQGHPDSIYMREYFFKVGSEEEDALMTENARYLERHYSDQLRLKLPPQDPRHPSRVGRIKTSIPLTDGGNILTETREVSR